MALADIDHLLDPGYLGDVSRRPLEEIRSMREECQQAETRLSFLRRVVQGRLDIVASEVARRQSGTEPDVGALVAQLPEILGKQLVGAGPARLPTSLVPDAGEDFTAELDAVADPGRISSMAELADDEVAAVAAGLAEFERAVSHRRRELHERLDALQTELVRRYKSGEADVESLLG